MKKLRRISFTVDEYIYNELLRYSRMKGHGGPRPVSAFVHYAAIQQMKKYPLSEAEYLKYEETYGIDERVTQAVQPDTAKSN